ncbi:MAG: D-alanine--D-alanine ligase family protein [Bacteroidales bacterium]|nr:D-alanine--D-alanine ligase family protein [Bacteroidales bacterium]
MERKNIALIYGGNSLEAEISIKSGKNVADNLDRDRYNIYEVLLRGESWRVINPNGEIVPGGFAEELLNGEIEIEKGYVNVDEASVNANNSGAHGRIKIEDMQKLPGTEIDKTDFSFTFGGVKTRFDYAFIMIHGNPGENGVLQGYLEMMDIPFNTCSSFVSTITFDKHSCKRFLDFSGVNLAKDRFIRKEDFCFADCDSIIEKLGLPLFVKPSDGGSSFGVTKVKRPNELAEAIKMAFEVSSSVLVEECIKGREVTNGIYTVNGKIVNLPVTEIVTDREFFDYEAKYLGQSREICPAPLGDELTRRVQRTSEKIYRYLGCKGLVRMDYFIRDDEIYFLELNTVPGMTAMSLVPAQVRAAGITMKELFNSLIAESI